MNRSSHDQASLRRGLKWTRLNSAARILIFVVAVVGTVAFLAAAEENALRDSSFTTGYLLFAAVMFLAAYNVRKKLPSLPLGSSRLWMQLHLSVGWTSIGLMLLHVGWNWAGGGLERMLLTLFVIVAGSGIFGLYLTKSIPKRLAALPTEVIFEQIPFYKREIANRAKQVAIESAASTDVITQLYQNHLATFFESPRSLWYFLRPTGAQRRSLQRMTGALDRFLSVDQRQLRDRLSELIMQKDDLDFQQALQLRLKAWLFLHIGFTYGLILVACFHGVAAHAFRG